MSEGSANGDPVGVAERELTDAPIFVVGFQRSGTTLLQALIGAHSRIASPPEMYFHYRVADHAEYFGDLADDGNLRRALHEAINPPLELLAESGFDEERLFERARGGPRTYEALLDVIMSDFAQRAGKVRWSEKSPGQPLDVAIAMFPRAQVVHIIRDPRDVVASSRRTLATASGATELARGWRDFTLRSIRRGLEIGPAQYLQIRYEDLTRDPAAVMRGVCSFLGEEFEPAMVDDPAQRTGAVARVSSGWQGRATEPVQRAAEGRWRAGLARADQARVHAVVGPLLAPLGYEPPGARARVAALPFRLADRGHRLRARLARAPRPMPAEERYRRMQEFLEAKAELGRAS